MAGPSKLVLCFSASFRCHRVGLHAWVLARWSSWVALALLFLHLGNSRYALRTFGDVRPVVWSQSQV